MPPPLGYTIRFPKEGHPKASYGSVAFKERHWKVFQNDIIPRHRAELTSAMNGWAEHGPQDLPTGRFKFQMSFELKGKRIRLETFKGWSVRFYGAVKEVDGRPMFLVTGYDTAKKDNGADQETLRLAAKAAYVLIHDN